MTTKQSELAISECIGCGWCCTRAKCAAGARLYPTAEVCPALKWNGKRHVCDLMQLPGTLGETYRKELYAGEGCCANLNSWRREPLKDRTVNRVDTYTNPLPPIMQKFLACLGKQWMSSDVIVLAVFAFIEELKKDGVTHEEAVLIGDKCISCIKENRSKMTEGFMG